TPNPSPRGGERGERSPGAAKTPPRPPGKTHRISTVLVGWAVPTEEPRWAPPTRPKPGTGQRSGRQGGCGVGVANRSNSRRCLPARCGTLYGLGCWGGPGYGVDRLCYGIRLSARIPYQVTGRASFSPWNSAAEFA